MFFAHSARPAAALNVAATAAAGPFVEGIAVHGCEGKLGMSMN